MRRLGIKLASLGGSDTLKSMSARAMSLCKAILEPSTAMEDLLTQRIQGGEVTKSDAQLSLQNIAPIYKSMIELYNEMCQVLKNSKQLDKSGVKLNFKPLKL